ncbi:uncharacterized protein L3040_004194 [Drepanopeziza brunnea f. sp. 'multigermtubi']|uniref:Calpain n=1 Tax=Marssonina brunnea f. sp. multigermtubi (strain MB_m1) TaxID=1072389 RepID=K1X5V7_MARBU|nr:calpain [Drepanopeziza brunnea f. sp. 'multigermtubi' MB_m1]EKD20517.1 calpain [Drepanopeziza brunnea f. sp. 'multigermtubi' MB_m1]KAJ5042801.1 hypothetical protein L3040_004194 [Drepanopeziza brunnea f. sp. 'multigermtubi']
METKVLPLTMPACLEDVRIKSLPATAFYISDFISGEEEQALLTKIETAPKPRWKHLSKRRLQTWPSDLTKNNALLDSPLPNWLANPITARLLSCPISSENQNHIFSNSPHKRPNHVLINEYLRGQGIMPHKDGSAYHPVVCTVSLGASLCLDIYGSNEDGATELEPRWKILQEPRSLLITTGELYTDFLHGIANVDEDLNIGPNTVANWDLLRDPEAFKDGCNVRQTRTSLTYRDVLRVSKLGGQLGLFVKR